jgi:rhodanese-related sulfurtransferase
VARELIEIGFTDVYALKGGWNKWLEDELPVIEQ